MKEVLNVGVIGLGKLRLQPVGKLYPCPSQAFVCWPCATIMRTAGRRACSL